MLERARTAFRIAFNYVSIYKRHNIIYLPYQEPNEKILFPLTANQQCLTAAINDLDDLREKCREEANREQISLTTNLK